MGKNCIDVFLITEYYFPIFGGAAERFRRYAPKLKEENINLHIFTRRLNDLEISEEIDGIPVYRIAVREGSKTISSLLLEETIKLIRCRKIKKPNVLHLLTHTLDGVPCVWQARLTQRIPCLNTITMMPMRSKPYPLRTKIHEWLRYCPFNLLVASSEVMAVNIAEFAISRKRISVISNGVDITRFKPVRNIEEKKSIKESLGLKKDARIILFVGSISRRKGVDLLIAAWPEIAGQIPSAYLVLVGPRSAQSEADKRLDSNFIAEIDQSIIKTTFDNRVIFSNYVTNVEQYMRCADVLVFPSRHEGMGNVVAESMASGLACVLTPYVGLPTEFGRPGKEYLLIEPNEKSIASAVINLLEDEEKRSSISLAACEWANKNLDVNHSIHRYAEVYARLNSLVK